MARARSFNLARRKDQPPGVPHRTARITVNIDEQGTPTVMGMSLADLAKLTGSPMAPLQLTPEQVTQFQANNIQHIELLHRGDGLYLFVNGKALPYIKWDQNTLQNAAKMLQTFDPQVNGMHLAEWIPSLLPMVRSVGLDLVFMIPVKAGATKIEVRPEDQEPPAPAADGAQLPAAAVVQLPIVYDAAGAPQVIGRGGQMFRPDAAALAQMGLTNLPIYLTPDTIQSLMRSNVQFITIQSSSAGLQVSVNNDPPAADWLGRGRVQRAGTGQRHRQRRPGRARPGGEVAPFIANLDLTIYMEFPLARGRRKDQPVTSK
ncbi:MAG: hypothetical protein IPM84_21895 [Anaerolineae bacterium]|nr:hypothetical protein [Anaerolineae bacterium]